MHQKQLFKDPDEIDLDSIDLNEGVDLALLDDRLVPEMFYIFPTGGYHLLNKCKKEIPEMYRQKIWPFILRNKHHPDTKRFGGHGEKGIIYGSVHSSFYICVNLPHKDQKDPKKAYHANGVYKTEKHKVIFNLLHRFVAKAFVPNPDNKDFVDHINGNKVDFRVENLKWCTEEENAFGAGTKRTMDEIFDKVKAQPWFNGKSSNQLNVHKVNYHKAIEENKKRKQIAFTFNTNF